MRARHLHTRISLYSFARSISFLLIVHISICFDFFRSTVEPMNVIVNNFSHNKNVVVGDLSALHLSFVHSFSLSRSHCCFHHVCYVCFAYCIHTYIRSHTDIRRYAHIHTRWIVLCTCENILWFTFY